MSTVSTHVLDTAQGRPAANVTVRLETRGGEAVGEGVPDADGRVGRLSADPLPAGDYRLRFDTGAYVDGFYPEVVIVFSITDPEQHFHVPLLLSPYGYSTYRGC